MRTEVLNITNGNLMINYIVMWFVYGLIVAAVSRALVGYKYGVWATDPVPFIIDMTLWPITLAVTVRLMLIGR